MNTVPQPLHQRIVVDVDVAAKHLSGCADLHFIQKAMLPQLSELVHDSSAELALASASLLGTVQSRQAQTCNVAALLCLQVHRAEGVMHSRCNQHW